MKAAFICENGCRFYIYPMSCPTDIHNCFVRIRGGHTFTLLKNNYLCNAKFNIFSQICKLEISIH